MRGRQRRLPSWVRKARRRSCWKSPLNDPQATWKEKEAEYAELFAHPYNAAARGYVDEVILPHNTRAKLIRAFEMLQNKVDTLPRKKHGNLPL